MVPGKGSEGRVVAAFVYTTPCRASADRLGQVPAAVQLARSTSWKPSMLRSRTCLMAVGATGAAVAETTAWSATVARKKVRVRERTESPFFSGAGKNGSVWGSLVT